MARRRRKGRKFLTLIIIATIATGAWYLFLRDQPPQPPGDDPNATIAQPGEPMRVEALTDSNADIDIERPGEPLPIPQLPPGQAAEAYKTGMAALEAEKLVEARTLLNKAYFANTLPNATQAELRSTLSELAEITLIGARSLTYQGDPYVMTYTVQPNDGLAKIEFTKRLHVPTQLLTHVNGLARAVDIKAGRQYKMVLGPFHAVIYKGAFLMDIYLHREGESPVFITRLPIGTGINGATPTGLWRVKLGEKAVHPTWDPPPNSELSGDGPIAYGQANYAFGHKGLWISLEGLDENTAGLEGYGIHSTNKPESIGKAESLGCIRLGDDDIELVFRLLYEHWSTVEIRQ